MQARPIVRKRVDFKALKRRLGARQSAAAPTRVPILEEAHEKLMEDFPAIRRDSDFCEAWQTLMAWARDRDRGDEIPY